MFEASLVYEDDVFGQPIPIGISGPAGVERFVPMPPRTAAAQLDAASEVSAPVAALLRALEAVVDQSPAELPGAQALADTAALLRATERLRAAVLPRLADVETRTLHTLDGAASTSSWVAQQQTSLEPGELALARRLSGLPRLDDAVRTGALSVKAAQRLGTALAQVRRHVDRPDGLVDGLDGEAVVTAVVRDGVHDLICTSLGGLADDDPRLAELIARLRHIAESPDSQLARLEGAFVLLAQRLEPAHLPAALSRLVDALLPSRLEERVRDAHAQRGFSIRLNSDGSGYHVTDGELDLETGELLSVVLQAELTVDPDNPADTDAYDRARDDGWTSADGHDALDPADGPRSLRQRRHDALRNALRRYLDSGVAGLRDKVAPHLSVAVTADLCDGRPGALPATTAAGTSIPTSLLRRWACAGALTRFVVGLGRKVIETSHTERTLKAHERRAKHLETGGRCQAAGCRCGPGRPLVPHHANAWARTGTTSLADTVLLCERCHHDLHTGRRTIRLRDGRRLSDEGWVDGPP